LFLYSFHFRTLFNFFLPILFIAYGNREKAFEEQTIYLWLLFFAHSPLFYFMLLLLRDSNPPGVNFTNILQAAFTFKYPKSTKRQ